MNDGGTNQRFEREAIEAEHELQADIRNSRVAIRERSVDRITLEIEITGQITAKFSGPHSSRIQELFQSTRVPTPFTFDRVRDVEHFGAVVITAIRSKNPGVEVSWSVERREQFVAFKFCQESRAGR